MKRGSVPMKSLSIAIALFMVNAVNGNAQTQTQTQPQPQPDPMRTDWPNLAKYRDANAKLGPPASKENRVVFIGNSITEGWAQFFPTMFAGKPYINRGIGGQTTPQMLIRFRQDVIALQMIEDNLASMTELAQSHGIRVVLSSVLPAIDFPWRPGLEPAPKVVALNKWMKDYAAKRRAVYLDYHSAMSDANGGMRDGLASDGVHPTEAGYRVMVPLVEKAISQALRKK